jgi:predicted O-linked N-acetylglucosamine transferase (SPINDLY family)
MNETLLQDAIRLQRAGRLTEAADIYAQLLKSEPRHFDALHGLSIIRYQTGRLEEAERLMGEAAEVNPKAANAFYNRACLLQKLNRLEEALACFDRAVAIRPDYVEALVNRSMVLSVLKRHDAALASLDAVVALVPQLPQAWNNRGSALHALERYEEALASYDRALSLKPDYAEAWKNRGMTLMLMQKPVDQILASFDKAAALAPKDSDVALRRADLLLLLERHGDAAQAYESYLALKPDDARAWNRRGSALQKERRRPEAFACFDKAVALSPADYSAVLNRANLLFELERFEDAARDYQAVRDNDPECPDYVTGYMMLCRLHACDWSGLEKERQRISDLVEAERFVLDPIGNIMLFDSPEKQTAFARVWATQKYRAAPVPLWRGEVYRHGKIRIAYLSADFRTHATAMLMAGVFAAHDRARFETTAISFGADDKSPMRARLEKGFDKFIDVRTVSDADVAQRLRDAETDIVIDLKGYTQEGRPGILAYRPAPIQAQYLGYPGTMAADYVDYVIADKSVIPDDHRRFFTEQVVYLPDTYQCNDSNRAIAPRAPSRFEVGLPEHGFVFCCFNNNHKILPQMFDVWMRLLRHVDGSVLWLLQDNAAVVRNLSREAQARGVAPERLVFAKRCLPPEHLARQRRADLFLDTLPYNAHTTCSDALWAGLPVLTVLGGSFAGRVAASLLTAIGLPELITRSLEEYEALALKLARDRSALAAITEKLARHRNTYPLFDTARFTRNLEAAYMTMWERYQRGELPQTFTVTAPS